MFGKSAWYAKIREAIGRGSEAAGVAVSALGASRLKRLWNPIEDVACDFLFFAVEQFAVGLRKDNPEKMQAQLDRLESVGSETRAAALREKLNQLDETPRPLPNPRDADMLAAAMAVGEANTQSRLEGR
jgi:hypothetical protein